MSRCSHRSNSVVTPCQLAAEPIKELYHLLAFSENPLRSEQASGTSASTGQVFQSGIGGSVSSGTFDGLGKSCEQRVGDQRRVKLAAG